LEKAGAISDVRLDNRYLAGRGHGQQIAAFLKFRATNRSSLKTRLSALYDIHQMLCDRPT
jgi:hypothetical protein